MSEEIQNKVVETVVNAEEEKGNSKPLKKENSKVRHERLWKAE